MESYTISKLRILFNPYKEPLIYLATLIGENEEEEDVQLLSSEFGVWIYFVKDQTISLAEGEVKGKKLPEYQNGDKLQCTHSFEPNY